MRLLLDMEATQHAAYNHQYNYKLQGRLYNALKNTQYSDRHGDGNPTGIAFSNPFPVREMDEGDERHLLISANEEDLLAHIGADLLDDRELNIGHMQYHINGIRDIYPDAGEPGSSGTLKTSTGICIRIPDWRFDEFGIKSDDDFRYWVPEYGMDVLKDRIIALLDQKHEQFFGTELPKPSETEYSLFDEFELISTYAKPLTVTTGVTKEHVLNKWKFDYTVKDQHHRRHLNLLLDTGIGERNMLGLGFINKELNNE